MRNDDGYSGVVMGVFILVIIAVGAVGFIMISNEYNIQYNNVISDPLNNTGIMVNNTTGYEATKLITTSASDNLYAFILFGIILTLLLIFGYIYNMSQSS